MDGLIASCSLQDDSDSDEIMEKSPANVIQIYKSSNVHIGDITNINGPIIVNHIPTPNYEKPVENLLHQIDTCRFPIIHRRNWLAQSPLAQPEYLKKPAKYVIISHSGTEEAFTQADNVVLVRLIQSFHVDGRKWSDIAYNFLIGGDGTIFEGRGWMIVGAHSLCYNPISIGINFIGCFTQKLPQEIALRKFHKLVKFGVEIGAIAADYKILAHCQCSSTGSPGLTFYPVIQTWDRWDSTISLTNPSPHLPK